MPIFGKKSKARKRTGTNKDLLDKTVFSLSSESARGRTHYAKPNRWLIEDSSLSMVSKCLHSLFLSHNKGKSFIETLLARKKDPLVVLDWGCGKGTAIEELALKYGVRVKAYGFSADSYADWSGLKKSKIIFNTKERLLKYFRKNSVDIIYSYYGVVHLFGVATSLNSKRAQVGVKYISALMSKLSPGGILAFNYRFENQADLFLELGRVLGSGITVHHDKKLKSIYFEKKEVK